MIPCRHFGTNLSVPSSKVKKSFLTLEDGTDKLSKKQSAVKHHYSLGNNPEDRNFQGPLFLTENIFLPNFTHHTHSVSLLFPFTCSLYSYFVPSFLPYVFILQMETFRIKSRHFTVKYCSMILTRYATRLVPNALLVCEGEVISNVTPGNKCLINIDRIPKY